jgi:hypothetical protein
MVAALVNQYTYTLNLTFFHNLFFEIRAFDVAGQ